jgi:hypothetical protein
MLSLNDMRPFGINPIIKLGGLGPKQIILYYLGRSVTYPLEGPKKG